LDGNWWSAPRKWARQRGLNELASDAEIANEESIRAHRALGFRETFRLVHFLRPVQT
jgi:aminoglycoside 6'-N-acetyltransferase I